MISIVVFNLMEVVGYTLIGSSIMYGIKHLKGDVKKVVSGEDADSVNLIVKLPRSRRD